MQFPFELKINKSHFSRSISIKVDSEGKVRVSAPKRASQKYIEDFVTTNQSKILNIIANLEPKQNSQIQFKTGSLIPFQGEEIKLYIVKKDLITPKAKLVSDSIVVQTSNENDQETIRKAIIKCFKNEARIMLNEILEEYGDSHGFKYKRVAIKDNRTNWGSCSAQNNLNFTWRLVLAPIKVMEYVVIHELCHTIQKDHSQKFWDLVEQIMPDYKIHRKWLKANGDTLRI